MNDILLLFETDSWIDMFRRIVFRNCERNARSATLTQGPVELNGDGVALSCNTLGFDTTTENSLIFGEQGKSVAINDGRIFQVNIVGVEPKNELHFGPHANTVENNGLVVQINIYRQVLVKDDKFYICATEATRLAFGNDKTTVKNNGTIVKIDIYGAELTQMTGELDLAIVRNGIDSPVVKIKTWNRREGQKIKINGGEIELPISKTDKLTGMVTDTSYVLNMTILAFPEKRLAESSRRM